MIIYESVLEIADVGEGTANIHTNIPFIIRHLATFFPKPCHLSVQIICPGYSRGRTTG